MASAAASCSSNSTRKKYDVFLSFRGEDTRDTFTCHLHDLFRRKKINSFIDEVGLNKGEEISSVLLEAIEESEISLIILSENYASSQWCLNELNHVLLCKEKNNQIVVPVFYHVDPANVRKQRGSYALAIAAHEDRLKDQMEKVRKWKYSLTTVANLSGFDSSKFGSDSKLLEAILQDVMTKLNPRLPYHHYYSKDLVGIYKRMQHIETRMNISSLDVLIVGIWGMGGIGKTTLARVVFDRFAASNHFEGFHFLENVKEVKRHELTKLRTTLFSELLKENNLNFVNQFPKRLRDTKVLIVLDDIDDVEQLEYLAGDRDWFGAGSRIVVTTRDMEVLTFIQADETYKVEELDPNEALELFCLRAFRRNSPTTNYEDLSERVVSYAKGIPLALKVLGSHLYCKSTKEWESALDKLRKDPNKRINEVLKLSYNGLEKNEQQIFLDIACFFKGQTELSFRTILKDIFGRDVDIGIRILEDRSLITRAGNNIIQMHDLLQQMGQSIVRDESKDPGERSRLCLIEDISSVLKQNTGTGAIQGISLEMHGPRNAIELKPHVFNEMHNLKYLNFHDHNYFYANNCPFEFPQGLDSLPDELRYIHWDNFPLTYLPRRFNPQNLVDLNFSCSKLKHLWSGVQNFANLKSLCLWRSSNLIQLPDLSQAVKLERMNLSSCESLENLPSSIGRLKSLQTLDLSYCLNFSKFPELLPANIKELRMNRTAIEEVPQSIESLSHLEKLHLSDCKRLKSLPNTICKLKSLQFLGLGNCSELEYLPEILEPMERLREIWLYGTGIRELPSTIENLCKIYYLKLAGCNNLRSVPHTISNMNLVSLSFRGCSKIKNLQSWKLMSLDFVYSLSLDNTSVSEIPDFFFHSKSLRELSLRGTKIRTIPASIIYSKLHELDVTGCKSLQSLPEPPVSMERVYASGCTSLQMVSHISIERVSNTWIAFKKKILEYYRYKDVEFLFDDCLKLDHNNVTTEFQVRALRLGTAFLERSKEIQEDKGFSLQVISSFSRDDEIPKWFNYQNDDGCFINMKLSPYCHDATNFMGIASCIVVEREFNGQENGFFLDCVVNVKTNDDERSFDFTPYEESPFGYTFASNRVIMWYFYTKEMNLSSVEEISVEFSIYNDIAGNDSDFEEEEWYQPPSTYELKRCGIRMLQLHDAVEFGIRREFVHAESNVATNELVTSGIVSVNEVWAMNQMIREFEDFGLVHEESNIATNELVTNGLEPVNEIWATNQMIREFEDFNLL